MKAVAVGFFCCAALSLAVFAQNSKSAGGTSDQDFVDMVAQTDMTEAHLGQLAATNASSQGVKDYADMLVTDHTKDYQQLSMIATQAGLTVPKGLDAKHEKMAAMYEKLKGAAFDKRYIHEMVLGHEAAIAAYNKESRDGQNAKLKDYATQALPTLEKHENGAKDLMKGGGKSAAKSST